MFNTNFVFTPGKLTTVMDASAGSSGKGKIGSFVCDHADNWQFAINAFSPQAGHWVRLEDGRKFFYQTFNSCAHMHEKYEKLYIGPGGVLELPAFFREMEENKIPRHKIGISPIAAILQQKDGDYEKGIVDLDGNPLNKRHDGTMKTGTTAHGAGAARARRVLRKKDALYARDIPELKEFICDVPREVMARLNSGQAGMLEVAQGFQLSYLLQDMFPFTTSRNCTIMAGLDDNMIPPAYAGNVIINCRTYPIRINNNKYIAKDDGRHLTWDEMQAGVPYDVYAGNSGPGYDDQQEITWEQLTKSSGSDTPIMELTSVTKLPRRVFTFSKKNLRDAIAFNKTAGNTYVSINFMNYVDKEIAGKSGGGCEMTQKATDWFNDNIDADIKPLVKFIGTGMYSGQQIVLE